MSKTILAAILAFALFYVYGKQVITLPLRVSAKASATQTAARPKPTPYPTPAIDISRFLHSQGGKTLVVEPRDDLGAQLNQADARLKGPGKLVVRGNGRSDTVSHIKTQVTVSHDLEFQTGTYACDTETQWNGCILLKDNVKVEAKGDVTILEPTYFDKTGPAITVFQSAASAAHNQARSEKITVKGIKIRGRQPHTDGGLRQAISFGNCTTCAAIDNTLENVSSIGIQWGGNAGNGFHAVDALATGNVISGAAAAAIAFVNVSGAHAFKNTITKPGRVNGPGGVSAFDIETNNTNDWCENVRIYNNAIDYGSAAFFSVGNAILGQNVYNADRSKGLLIVNNTINGVGPSLGLSNGLFFVGKWEGGIVANNLVTRALQMGISCTNVQGLSFLDNWLVSCGGGGSPSVYLIGGGSNIFRRNRIWTDQNIVGSSSAAIWQKGSSGNVFENLEDGGVASLPN